MLESSQPTQRQNVDLIRVDDREVYLVGTAHVSAESVQLVEDVVREVHPDTIAIELCSGREQALRDPDRWKKMDIVEVVRSGRAHLLLAQLLMVAYQRRIGKALGITPGAEMLKSLHLADELGARIIHADRDIRTTLRRVWGSLGFWSTLKLFSMALAGSFQSKEVSKDEIERLKSADALEEALREFGAILPEVRRVIIDERDQYLAAKIAAAGGKRVVAVVGAGHVPGIKRCFGKPIDIADLEKTPPPKLWLRVVGWGIPAAILAMFIYGFFTLDSAGIQDIAIQWIWITALTAGFGALLALAHPISILGAALSAPVTTLHPLLASGWIAGLLEVYLRRPTVADFEAVPDDILTLKGWYRNRISRILLIVALTNLCGSLGMLIGGSYLAAALSK